MAQQDVNMVTLVGRLTRDAEARQAGETTVRNMRLAVNGRRKSGDGWEDQGNFFDVVLFGRDGLAPFLVKGQQVAVSGRLAWREWTDKDGGKRQSVEVVANDVQLLGSSKREGGEGGGLPGEWGSLPSEKVGGGSSAPDDIPFGPSRV